MGEDEDATTARTREIPPGPAGDQREVYDFARRVAKAALAFSADLESSTTAEISGGDPQVTIVISRLDRVSISLAASASSHRAPDAAGGLNVEIPGPVRVISTPAGVETRLDVPNVKAASTMRVLVAYLLISHARVRRTFSEPEVFDYSALLAELEAAETLALADQVKSPEPRGAERLVNGLLGSLSVRGVAPRSPCGDVLVGLDQGGSEGVVLGRSGLPSAWVRLIDREGRVFVRVHVSIGRCDPDHQANLEDWIEQLISETQMVRMILAGESGESPDLTKPGQPDLHDGRTVVATVEWPVVCIDSVALTTMVWAVASLADWAQDEFQSLGFIEKSEAVDHSLVSVLGRDAASPDAPRAHGHELVVTEDLRWLQPGRSEASPKPGAGVPEAELSAFAQALANLRARKVATGIATDIGPSSPPSCGDGSTGSLEQQRSNQVVPPVPSWRNRRRDIPRSGPGPSEFVSPVAPGVSPMSALWVRATVTLRQLIHGESLAAAQSLAEQSATSEAIPDARPPGDAVAIEALDVLLAGPSGIEGLDDFAASHESLGEETVANFVTERVERAARDRVTRCQRDAREVSAWANPHPEYEADEPRPSVAAEWLRQCLVEASGEDSSFAAAVATHSILLGGAQPSEAVGVLAAKVQELEDPSVSVRGAEALLDLAREALADGLVTVVLPHSADGDRLAFAALIEVSIGLNQARRNPNPEAAVRYLGGTVRAADLLRLRIKDGVGPIALTDDGPLVAERRAGLSLFLGPPGSGKTSTLNLAAASHGGPVVATTSKANDWDDSFVTIRALRGPVWLFDPANSVSDIHPSALRVRWDLVDYATDHETARRFAHSLTVSTSTSNLSNGDFWAVMAELTLGPLLLAANRARASIAKVLEWTDGGSLHSPIEILRSSGEALSVGALNQIESLDPRTRDSVIATVSQTLAPFSTGTASALANSGEVFDPIKDLIDCEGTLLLCLDAVLTSNLAGMVSTFLDWLGRARIGLADQGWTGAPLLIAGDEIANIAPIPSLPRLLAEGPGRGIQAIVCLQDSSQAIARWGSLGELFLTSSGNRVLFPGVTRADLLSWVEPLLGNHPTSRSVIGFQSGSRTVTASESPVSPGPLDAGEVARPGAGRVTVVTPGAFVLSARQARAQDDLLYRQALVEAGALETAWRALPPELDLPELDLTVGDGSGLPDGDSPAGLLEPSGSLEKDPQRGL